jgi:Zn-dependent peptidase ImmA (M78 family)
MVISWPELSTAQIEEKAASFRLAAIQTLGLEAGGPVPVEQIAEIYLGYELDFVEQDESLPSDVIGGIDFDNKTIIVNSSIESHLGRYSFTIAHEIAHHVLHREIFMESRTDDKIMCRGGKSRPIEEMQADRFAEALLMPKELVIKAVRSIQTTRPMFHKSRIVLAAKAIKVSGLSNVSVTAMDMRLQHLNLSTKSGWIDSYLKWLLKRIERNWHQKPF